MTSALLMYNCIHMLFRSFFFYLHLLIELIDRWFQYCPKTWKEIKATCAKLFMLYSCTSSVRVWRLMRFRLKFFKNIWKLKLILSIAWLTVNRISRQNLNDFLSTGILVDEMMKRGFILIWIYMHLFRDTLRNAIWATIFQNWLWPIAVVVLLSLQSTSDRLATRRGSVRRSHFVEGFRAQL